MSSETLYCDQLFDGERVHTRVRVHIRDGRICSMESGAPALVANGHEDVGTLRCHFAMPALIDASARVFGAFETPRLDGNPYELHEVFLRLMLYGGVGCVRDAGNSFEALSHLRAWAGEHLPIMLVSGGPALDQPPVTSLFARRVDTPDEAAHEVARLACEGAALIQCGGNVTAPVLAAIVQAATAHGLPVYVMARDATADMLTQPGIVCVESLVGLSLIAGAPADDEPEIKTTNGTAPCAAFEHELRLHRWLNIDAHSARADEVIAQWAARRTAVCPLLLALRRRIFLDEVINDPYLDFMIAVLPVHRHFRNMRNSFGYAMGRKHLQQHLPYPTLDKKRQRELDEAWMQLTAFLVRLNAAGVRLVAGSGAPTPSVCPGFGLHQELRLWAQAGIPALDALKGATSNAADMLGCDDVGRLRVGAQANLLLLDADPTADLGCLSANDNRLMMRGELVDRQQLKTTITSYSKRHLALA